MPRRRSKAAGPLSPHLRTFAPRPVGPIRSAGEVLLADGLSQAIDQGRKAGLISLELKR